VISSRSWWVCRKILGTTLTLTCHFVIRESEIEYVLEEILKMEFGTMDKKTRMRDKLKKLVGLS